MRNLKRILSLTLASAMLFGMMVMGASAADTTTYADQNSITKAEAVAVMSAVGVFKGADGKFNPTGALTRESAAKIITYMVMGEAAADDLKVSAAPFTDVAANRWSAGSIAYCAANGIIAGDGQGNFYPELTVNGYAFAKMLLGALGYNATTEKMTSPGWESNVAKLVNRAALKTGIAAALSANMTREDAAQMAFNAIQAETVAYSNNGSITSGDINIDLGGKREDAGIFMTLNYSTLVSETDGQTDAFGRPGTTWTLGDTKVGTYGASPKYTFTTAKAKLSDLGLSTGITLDSGVVITSNTKDAVTIANLAAIATACANGRKVELYVAANKITNIVITDTFLSTIGTVNTVNKSVSLKVVGGFTFATVTNEDQPALYAALADMGKDAKVLVTADDDGKVLTVAEPETAEGTYTAKASNGNRTIGGTKYVVANTMVEKELTDMKTGTTYTVYLDTYGNMISSAAEAAAATSYGFLSGMERNGSGSTGYTYSVNLLLNDGTQEWVEVTTVGTKATTKIDSIDAFAKELFGTSADDEDKGIVSYSEKSDGSYTLKSVTGGTATTGTVTADTDNNKFYSFENLIIKKGEAKFFGGTTATAIQGSSKTIFLVGNASGSYSKYEGVKNVPNLEGADGFVLISKGTTTASLVVVTEKTNAVDASALAYLVSDAYETTYDETLKQEVYIYDAIVDGEIVKLTTTVIKVGAAGDNDAALDAGMYTVSYDSNSYGVKLVAAEVGNDKLVRENVTAKVSNGTIVLADKLTGENIVVGGTYVTADDFKVLVVDKKGKAAEIAADDVAYYTSQANAYVIMDSDKQFATTLIVVETPEV